MHYAVNRFNNTSIIQFLLENGADINALDNVCKNSISNVFIVLIYNILIELLI